MLLPMHGAFVSVPTGDAGTAATLNVMRRLAIEGSAHPAVRERATGIVLGVGGNQRSLQARLIRQWVEDHTVFLRDPTHVEALHTAEAMLRQIDSRGVAQVDCDDVAVLTAALGGAIGLKARFVVVGFQSPNAPFAHVWTELRGSQSWVPVDPTRPVQGLSGVPISRAAQMEV